MKRGILAFLILGVMLSSAAYGATLIAASSPEKLLFGVGKHYFGKNDYSNSEVFFQEAIQQSPTYARAYHNLAVSQYKQGKFKEAINNFEAAINQDLGYSLAYYNLGLLHFEIKNYEESIANLEKAVAIDAAQERHFDLAQSYVALFRQKEGLEYLTIDDLQLLRDAMSHFEQSSDIENSASNLEIVRQVLSDYESQ